MENSRVIKYIYDRGVRVYTILTSTHCCISSLVQGGFDIPGCVEVHVLATVKNKEPTKIYERVLTLYYQREETHIAGFFIDGGSEIKKNDKDRRKKIIKTT